MNGIEGEKKQKLDDLLKIKNYVLVKTEAEDRINWKLK